MDTRSSTVRSRRPNDNPSWPLPGAPSQSPPDDPAIRSEVVVATRPPRRHLRRTLPGSRLVAVPRFRLDRRGARGDTATTQMPSPETDSCDRAAPARVTEDEQKRGL